MAGCMSTIRARLGWERTAAAGLTKASRCSRSRSCLCRLGFRVRVRIRGRGRGRGRGKGRGRGRVSG